MMRELAHVYLSLKPHLFYQAAGGSQLWAVSLDSDVGMGAMDLNILQPRDSYSQSTQESYGEEAWWLPAV